MPVSPEIQMSGRVGSDKFRRFIMTKPIIKPGETSPKSGQYLEVGPRGGQGGREVTVPKGRPMPPSTDSGRGYILVDPTNNKSGKK